VISLDRLKDKVAIVTGGAHGIGAAIAQRFIAENARVVIVDVNETAGNALAVSIGADFMTVNVAEHDSVGRLIAWVASRYGRIDTVVSDAAISPIAPIEELSPANWDETIAVNLNAAYHLAHFAAPHLRRQRSASIILISSVQAQLGFKTFAAYAASKGGLLGLMHELAAELAPEVRVNAISPGTIDSYPESPHDAEIWRALAMKNLMRRVGQPVEIANAALFLASDEASFITGHNLVVDGGMTAKGD
jgi:NAD(P)-dependent dehydrogenase (short-subunit alcohol dehydrogenase family)